MTLDSSRVATLVVSVVLIIYGSFRWVQYVQVGYMKMLLKKPCGQLLSRQKIIS